MNIFRNRGSQYMLISTVLYGFIHTISKVGMEASSVTFYTFAAAFGLMITIFPLAYFRAQKRFYAIFKTKKRDSSCAVRFIDAVKILALMATISTTYVGFADAANNTSILYNQGAAKFFYSKKK